MEIKEYRIKKIKENRVLIILYAKKKCLLDSFKSKQWMSITWVSKIIQNNSEYLNILRKVDEINWNSMHKVTT